MTYPSWNTIIYFHVFPFSKVAAMAQLTSLAKARMIQHQVDLLKKNRQALGPSGHFSYLTTDGL